MSLELREFDYIDALEQDGRLDELVQNCLVGLQNNTRKGQRLLAGRGASDTDDGEDTIASLRTNLNLDDPYRRHRSESLSACLFSTKIFNSYSASAVYCILQDNPPDLHSYS